MALRSICGQRPTPAKRGCVSSARQEFEQVTGYLLRLLLLHPVPGALDEVAAGHSRAGALLHALEIARPLIDPPVALSCDKRRADVDRAAREELQLRDVLGTRRATVPVEAALEADPRVLVAVDLELVIGKPFAGGDRRRRRHLRRYRFRHSLVLIQDVVRRQLRELARGPRC